MTIEVIQRLEDFAPLSERGTVVTVGTFDGLHRGHKEIFCRTAALSRETGLEAVMVTFHPHPRVVVTPGDAPLLLTTLEEKQLLLPRFFSGRVVVLEFNRDLQNLTAEQFVRNILVDKLRAKKLIVGYDHALGKNRSGTIVELTRFGAQLGFEVEVVGPIVDDGKPISSTRIRHALEENRYAEALRLLGHDYPIHGIVERGIGLGRKLGYPTANVGYSERKLLPTQGVYSCWALVGDRRLDGMMFVGRNHFNPQARITVEANLFDFDEDIYGREITVFPSHFLRENRRFESKEALVLQIASDKESILKIIDKEKKNAS